MLHKFAALAFALLLAGCGDGFAPEQQADQNPPEKGLRCQSATPVSAHQALLASYANPLIVADSADFDGSNDYMLRGAGLSGAADSKSGILSAWVRIDGNPGSGLPLLYNGSLLGAHFFALRADPTQAFVIQGLTSGGSVILDIRTAATYGSSATWLHLLASWDLATGGARSIYINDVSDLSEVAFVDNTIDYTGTDFAVGTTTDVARKMDGCLAELYFAPGQYLDFSLVHNRRKFISASGKPVHLGTTGALPTGTAPLVYLHLADGEAVANFATNRGTGGNFTVTGSLDTGSTSPSD